MLKTGTGHQKYDSQCDGDLTVRPLVLAAQSVAGLAVAKRPKDCGGPLDTVSVDRQQPSPLLLLALRPLTCSANMLRWRQALGVACVTEAVACPHIPRWR